DCAFRQTLTSDVQDARFPGASCRPPPWQRHGRRTARIEDAAELLPADDLHAAVEMLDDGGAALHPVAGIDVGETVEVAGGGGMDMAADDAVDAMSSRLGGKRCLEAADEVDRVFHSGFCPRRQR